MEKLYGENVFLELLEITPYHLKSFIKNNLIPKPTEVNPEKYEKKWSEQCILDWLGLESRDSIDGIRLITSRTFLKAICRSRGFLSAQKSKGTISCSPLMHIHKNYYWLIDDVIDQIIEWRVIYTDSLDKKDIREKLLKLSVENVKRLDIRNSMTNEEKAQADQSERLELQYNRAKNALFMEAKKKKILKKIAVRKKEKPLYRKKNSLIISVSGNRDVREWVIRDAERSKKRIYLSSIYAQFKLRKKMKAIDKKMRFMLRSKNEHEKHGVVMHDEFYSNVYDRMHAYLKSVRTYDSSDKRR